MVEVPVYTCGNGCTIHEARSGDFYIREPGGGVLTEDGGNTLYFGNAEHAIEYAEDYEDDY